MKLFLLKRDISQYTFPDILLGCFTNLEKAQNARREYLAQYQLGKRIDPWKEQGNKTVVLDDDVEIIDSLPVIDFNDTEKTVFVINFYFDGWGQVMRKIFALCGTQEVAQERLTKIQIESSDEFQVPGCFRVGEIFLDKLYPDDNLQDGYWWK
ncbi:MAG: hypothetical protein L0Z71_13005 [Anaerolineae bacterium]|nr:hypothetical protein [Anaerolineae bacterium]